MHFDIILGWSQATSSIMERVAPWSFFKSTCDHNFLFGHIIKYIKGSEPCLTVRAQAAVICNCLLHVYISCIGLRGQVFSDRGALQHALSLAFAHRYKDRTRSVLPKDSYVPKHAKLLHLVSIQNLKLNCMFHGSNNIQWLPKSTSKRSRTSLVIPSLQLASFTKLSRRPAWRTRTMMAIENCRRSVPPCLKLFWL